MRKTFGCLYLVAAGLLLASLAVHYALPWSASPPRWPSVAYVLAVAALDVLAGRRLRSDRPRRRWLVLPLALLLLQSLATVSYTCVLSWVDYHLARHEPGAYDDCHKIWGARGLVLEGPDITHSGSQNSIESVSLAFARGAKGSEVDVFFDTERREYIVSHDRPYNLKNGAILTLEELFDAIGDEGWFWLDFKKLRHLSDDELANAVSELERLTASGDRKRRVYVEGEAPFSLLAFQRAGFPTLFDSHPVADSSPITPLLINLYKAVYWFGGYTVFGLNYGSLDEPIYGPHTRAALRHVPAFVYHVPPDEALLRELCHDDAVRVILVENHSLDRFGIDGCD